MSKLSIEIKRYAVSRKLRNPELSCRAMAQEISDRYKIKFSKSSVNKLFLDEKLSSPKGRSVAKIYRPCLETAGAGYGFFLGACLLLGLPAAIARTIKKLNPFIRLKPGTIETISEAWIMSKAIYNTSLDKIADYSKNELWNLIGKKASKGLLKEFIGSMRMMQLFDSHIFSELSARLQDVHALKFSMADGTFFLVDGKFYGLWDQKNIPFSFSTTIGLTESYINNCILKEEPLVIFNTKPEGVLGQTLTDFVFSLSGTAHEKKIIKIEMLSPKGIVVKEVPFIVSGRRGFAVGIWPWQYKAIGEFEKKKATGSYYLEPTDTVYPFVEEEIRFSQHVHNNEVKLRMIVIKNADQGSARIAVLTNIDRAEMSAKQIVGLFVRRWNDFEGTHGRMVSALKKPPYLEDFVLAERILDFSKKILSADGPDEAFSVLVEVVHIFAQRSFFPPEVNAWSFLKMREIFYKSQGLVKRDFSDDILFNLFKSNELQYFDILKEAAAKFNELSILELPVRKLWIDCKKSA